MVLGPPGPQGLQGVAGIVAMPHEGEVKEGMYSLVRK